MLARDLMTTSVLTVSPGTPVQRIAQLLLEHGISAVPVVADGAPVGIISETDLVARSNAQHAPRSNWVVRLLADRKPLAADFQRTVLADRTARDVMTSPVVTTPDDADVSAILQLMMTHGIKRLPVVRAGRIVGIISRADLLRAIAQAAALPAPLREQSALANGFTGIDKTFLNGRGDRHAPAATPAEPEAVISAKDFRSAVDGYKQHAALERAEAKRLQAEQHAHDVEIVLGTHLTEDWWRHMLLGARRAAENGETEYQALQIPREACSDGGRMINMAETGWPSTLRGEAAELWLRWSKELQPRGFRLAARTIDYPDGLPGDIGLFLVWKG